MISKVKTIWKYGIVFGETQDDIDSFASEVGKVIWKGKISKIPSRISKTVVEIHPRYDQYFEAALMPLYKTYGRYKRGTENPTFALETLKTKKESQYVMPYILIWKIL